MKIEINKELPPYLNRAPEGTLLNKIGEDLINGVLPLLTLFPKANTLGILASGSLQVLAGVKELYKAKEDAWEEKKDKIAEVAAKVVCVALPLFFSRVGSVPGHLYACGTTLQASYKDLKEGKNLEALKKLVSCLSTLAYLGSSLYGLKEYLFLSLVLQVLQHVGNLSSHIKQKEYFQALSNLILLCLRSKESLKLGKILHRNYFGQKVSSEEVFFALVEEASKTLSKKLEEVLEKKGVSSHIKNLKVFSGARQYEGIDFSGLTLEDSTWEGLFFRNCIFDVKVKNSKLSNLYFKECLISDSSIKKSGLRFVIFDECKIERTSFIQTNLQKVAFKTCRIVHCLFEVKASEMALFNTRVYQTIFQNTFLQESVIFYSYLDQVQFIAGNYQTSKFYINNTKKVLFQGVDLSSSFVLEKDRYTYKNCQMPSEKAPKIIFSWGAGGVGEYTHMQDECLAKMKFQVVPSFYTPLDIDQKELTQEIQALFQKIEKENLPIVPTFMQSSSPAIQKVVAYADHIVSYSDGVFLPGGEDVFPRFYGKFTEDTLWYSLDRDLFELALLHAAEKYQKPVFGICRGAQIGNVYHGGTLKDVKGHFGVKKVLSLEEDLPEPLRETLEKILGKTFSFEALHKQAVDRLGKGLFVASQDNGVAKLLISEEGREIFSQVHPESSLEDWQEIKTFIGKKEWQAILENMPIKVGNSYLTEIDYYSESGIKAQRLFELFKQKALASRWISSENIAGVVAA